MLTRTLLPALLDRAVLRPEWPFDSFFEGFEGDPFFAPLRRATAAFQPAADLCETDDEYIVRLEVPGLEKDDVAVEVLGDTVTIRGEKRNESEEKAEGVHRYERRYGSFSRTFRFGKAFDPEKIQAELKNGILTVTLPKTEEARPRRIAVKHAGAAEERALAHEG